jgi:chromate transporter
MSKAALPTARPLGSPDAAPAEAPPHPTLAQALAVWARIGLISFGGPAGQIALMHRMLVVERRWLSEARFLRALNFCMLLPGPEAMQLATYVGWLMHGLRGGLAAGALFILPGALAVLGLSAVYAAFGQVGAVAALFFGLKAAVLAIVVQAVVRIGGRALRGPAAVVVAALAFGAIFALGVPFPVIVGAAGLAGWGLGRMGLWRVAQAGPAAETGPATVLGEGVPAHARFDPGGAMRLGAVFLGLWLLPLAGLALALGPEATLTRIGGFFAIMAVVTFGGAYAVLAWVAQAAVGGFGWLSPAEMIDALALAETTPGPLILVTQFVGFLAAHRDPGAMDPFLAGTLGALLTTWVTFVPCFLWVFLGAPAMERLQQSAALAAALGAITAAVVGVIANLALWFALHVLFTERRPVGWLAADAPVVGSLDPVAAALASAALAGVFTMRLGPVTILGGSAVAGLALAAFGLV